MARLLGATQRTAQPEIDNIVEHAAGLRSLVDASRILRMRPEDLLALLDRGVFPDAYRDDGQWRIPLDDIRHVLRSRACGAEAAAVHPAVLVRRRRPYGEPGEPPAWLTPAERGTLITRKLERQRAVRISSLSAELGVSQMTIRRDLARLAAEGLLVRTYGGALAPGCLALLPVARSDRTEL
jgi:hypothetical protein